MLIIGKPGTGTCEKIGPGDLAGDPKSIPTSQMLFMRVLDDKFLDADSVEISNLHFFTRSRRDVFR